MTSLPEHMRRYASYLKGAFSGIATDSITSESTHEVTGRGTIKQCRAIDGPFWVGQEIVIDGQRWTVTGIEMISPAGASVGLIVKTGSV